LQNLLDTTQEIEALVSQARDDQNYTIRMKTSPSGFNNAINESKVHIRTKIQEIQLLEKEKASLQKELFAERKNVEELNIIPAKDSEITSLKVVSKIKSLNARILKQILTNQTDT
jgi:hypothetical protein